MISIIVPVYNAEQYLHRCIDSILTQSHSDFELLLVDDGSPDNCGAICDEYAAKDTRVRVFHKENGGVSSARNFGIEQAQGEWVSFVDSDDWIASEFLERLIQKPDADFILGGVVRSTGKVDVFPEKKYEVQEISEFIDSYINVLLLRTPWGKLLRRNIIVDNHIRFDEQMKYGEDTIFVYQYLCFCHSIRTVEASNYNYLQNQYSGKYRHSFSDVDYALKKTEDSIADLCRVFSTNIDMDLYFKLHIVVLSIRRIPDMATIEAYYLLCKKYNPTFTPEAFYNNPGLSPVIKGLFELKCLYEDKSYVEAKRLFSLLHEVSAVAPKNLRFIYKDFYLWYSLIRINAHGLCDILLRFYFFLKRIIHH